MENIDFYQRKETNIFTKKKRKHSAFIIWPWCHGCLGISCLSCLPPLRFDMKSFSPRSKEYIAFDRLLQSTISFGWRTYQMQYTGIMKLLNFNCLQPQNIISESNISQGWQSILHLAIVQIGLNISTSFPGLHFYDFISLKFFSKTQTY